VQTQKSSGEEGIFVRLILEKISGQRHSNLRKNAFILWSIFKSFNLSAYYVLWIKGLQIILLPLDLLLSLLERLFVPKGSEVDYPIIFVVGIHRTGSTFVSQVLADCFGFAPLGNFATLFPRSRYLIHKMFKGLYRPGKPGKTERYKSYYGISKGLFSIGDSYEIWDKWLGKDHYNRPGDISDEKRADMVTYFSGFQKAWERPVITKNNRNTLILEMIQETIPKAFFVVVNRTPADVIQSTMRASIDFFGTDEIVWGLREDSGFNPDNYKDKLDAYCHQYLDLQDSLTRSLNAISGEDYLMVQYEDFCEDAKSVQKELWNRLGARYNLPDSSKEFGTSKYYTSRRLYDAELSAEINRRIQEIRTSQSVHPSNV